MATVLTQAKMNQAQTGLRLLVDMAGAAHAELCDLGLTAERDHMRYLQSKLMEAESIAGGIAIPMNGGVIQPQSGGK